MLVKGEKLIIMNGGDNSIGQLATAKKLRERESHLILMLYYVEVHILVDVLTELKCRRASTNEFKSGADKIDLV